MTEYEIAQIKLRAFELLAGWGNKVPPDENCKYPTIEQWNLQERTKYASVLAEWAMHEGATETVAAERERCAQVADSMNSTQNIGDRIRHGLGGSGETQL